jgi:hypothetical protein
MKKTYKSKRANNKLIILDKGKSYTITFVNDIYETSKAEEIALLDSILSHKGIRASFYLFEGEVAPKKEEPKKEVAPVYEVEVKAEAQKKEVELVEYEASTVQAAARVLCDNYNLSMREVNTIAKIEAKAKELGCAFPKLRK